MKYWLLPVLAIAAVATVQAAISAPPAIAFPEHRGIKAVVWPTATLKKLSVLKVGMTRKEVDRYFTATDGVMYSFAEPYALRHARTPDGYGPVVLDIIFKPTAMDEATFADAARRTAWYRNHDWWPGEDLNDTVEAFSKPYAGFNSQPVLDFAKLPKSAQATLKSLRLGMARNKFPRGIGPNGGLLRPEPEYLLDPPIPGGSNEYVAVCIAFKPGAWDDRGREIPKAVIIGITKPYVSSPRID